MANGGSGEKSTSVLPTPGRATRSGESSRTPSPRSPPVMGVTGVYMRESPPSSPPPIVSPGNDSTRSPAAESAQIVGSGQESTPLPSSPPPAQTKIGAIGESGESPAASSSSRKRGRAPGEVAGEPFEYSICKKEFLTVKALFGHMRSHQAPESDPLPAPAAGDRGEAEGQGEEGGRGRGAGGRYIPDLNATGS